MQKKDKKIVFENGAEYYGYSFGSKQDKVLELVFNTSMVGYQEILSDPSYTYQAVVLTYPLIGNYGMARDDYECKNPSIGGLIVKEYNDLPSNYRSEKTLGEVMEECGVVGIYGVDTRKLTRIIRTIGSCKVLLCDADLKTEDALQALRSTSIPTDAVSKVSTKKSYFSKAKEAKFHVVAVDCGMKLNIVRSLNARGCDVTVVPYNVTADEILKLNPDGLFISNGPSDPTDAVEVIEAVKSIKGKLPVFGICLGHQIICLAYGAKTYKLKFGHRGANHPVKNLENDKIEITSQNHSYAVDADSLKDARLKITHINLLDNTVEGVECKEDKIFSVQYHPESAPGPQDSSYLFDKFISAMKEVR
ncbi:MAG: glutamine-hydrolyzing carbamoyl-phosphate synthase small subunit [Christensenellaceae bacterium]